MGAVPADSPAQLHVVFLAILPRIERHGNVYFRHKNADQREEMIAEMVAICWRWFLRLVERGKDPSQFTSALATYAARAVSSGRRVCGQEKGKDVLSPLAQRMRGFIVGRLPDYSTLSHNPLEEALADNTVTPVDLQAAFRIDFPAWLSSLAERDLAVALDLMAGERTLDVAARHGRSPGRISQLRRLLHDDWLRFHGETAEWTTA